MIDLENLPKDGPVLLILNHPGGFIDACVISTFSPRPYYFLTRGDFFKKGFATRFLNASHQIPIFRAEDGIKNLRGYRQTFSKCFDTLSENKVLLIFPESWAIPEKKLRKLFNGSARIMFGMHEEHPDMSPLIVPVGVTFTDANQFGRDAFFRFGKPISVREHIQLHQEHPRQAYDLVMQEIEVALRSLMVILDTDEREDLFDDAMILIETALPVLPIVSHDPKIHNQQVVIANRVNAFDEGKLNMMKLDIEAIKTILSEVNLPFYIYPFFDDKRVVVFWLVLFAPILLIGKILQAAPVWLTFTFTINKIKKIVFIGPVKSMAGFYIHAIYYTILTVILVALMGNSGWLVGILSALLGMYTLLRHRRPHLIHWFRWKRISTEKKHTLKQHRQSLKEMLAPSMAE